MSTVTFVSLALRRRGLNHHGSSMVRTLVLPPVPINDGLVEQSGGITKDNMVEMAMGASSAPDGHDRHRGQHGRDDLRGGSDTISCTATARRTQQLPTVTVVSFALRRRGRSGHGLFVGTGWSRRKEGHTPSAWSGRRKWLSPPRSPSRGSPKKICDQVSDAVLVGIYEQPPDIAGGMHVGGESEMDRGPGGQEIRSGYTTDRRRQRLARVA